MFLFRDYFAFPKTRWELSLPNSFNEFYQKRSKNTKSNIRKYANRMKRAFGEDISVKCFKKENEIDHAMKDIESVASKTYQRGFGIGFCHSPLIRYDWMFAAMHNWLRVYVLYIQNKPCAFWTGYLYKKTLHIFIPGYDPYYQYYHTGMFLLMRIIENSCLEDDVKSIDFGLIDASYKREYCDKKWQETCLYIFAPNLKGLTLSLMRNITSGTTEFIKMVLTRVKVIEWVKKEWRQKVSPSKRKPI